MASERGHGGIRVGSMHRMMTMTEWTQGATTDRTVRNGGVDLYWIPLGAGAGGAVVRWSGRLYEAVAAALARRPRCNLFHSALEVS